MLEPGGAISSIVSTDGRSSGSMIQHPPSWNWSRQGGDCILGRGQHLTERLICLDQQRSRVLAAGWHETLNAETVGDGDDPALVTEANLLT